MLRLSSPFAPRSLAEVVGQPPVNILRRYASLPPARRPSRCFLMEGDGGTGKSVSAYLLAEELGAGDETAFGSGYFNVIPASELRIEQCNELFGRVLRLSFAWKVVILEELDGLPSKAVERFLKVNMEEQRLPSRTTVVATSNGAGNLDPAFLQRFRILRYGNGPSFRTACQDRLGELWKAETGQDDLPTGWLHWGVTSEG
ncbi:MAG: AAA family ATPase, partial [Pirellulaceae bacterium]